MLKLFSRRLFASSQLVKAGAPANLTKVASAKPQYYEYRLLSFKAYTIDLEFKSSRASHSASTSRRMLCCSPLRQSLVSERALFIHLPF